MFRSVPGINLVRNTLPATERFDGRVWDATCGSGRGGANAEGVGSDVKVSKASGSNKTGQDRGEERVRDGVALGILKERAERKLEEGVIHTRSHRGKGTEKVVQTGQVYITTLPEQIRFGG